LFVDNAKNLADALNNIMAAVKDAKPIQEIQQREADGKKSVAAFLSCLQSGVSLIQDLDKHTASISAAHQKVNQPVQSAKAYEAIRDEMSFTSRELANAMTELASADVRNTGALGLAAGRLTDYTISLVEGSRAAQATTDQQNAKTAIVQHTGHVCDQALQLLQTTKHLVQNPNDTNAKSHLQQLFQSATTSMANLVEALRQGSVAETKSNNAINQIRKATTQLNQAQLKAKASQLEGEERAKAAPLDKILNALKISGKNLIANSHLCGEAAVQSGNNFGEACLKTGVNITNLAQHAVNAASRILDDKAQQELLSAAKMLTLNAEQILLAAKDVHRLPDDKTAKSTLTDAQEQMKSNVQKMFDTSERSAAEAVKGERALEDARKKIQGVMTNIPGHQGANGESVIKAVRQVVNSTAEIVFAPSQDDIIASSAKCADATILLLNVGKTASTLSPDPNVQKELVTSVVNVANSILALMETGKLNRQDQNTQPKLEAAAEHVTAQVQALETALRKLPNSENLSVDEGADLEMMAEKELMQAAKAIQEAAAMIMAAKPRTTAKVDGIIDESDIQAAILDAARAIAKATANLVAAAAVAQKERRESRPKGQRYKVDPTWANGLISAAQGVATSVKMLVQTANSSVSGKIEEERLEAAARGVSTSTAQLVAAARAKAEANSKGQQGLALAAKTVSEATAQLVNAANNHRQMKEQAEAQSAFLEDSTVTNSKVRQLEQVTKILMLERQLENERKKMMSMNKESYNPKGKK